MMKSSAKKSGQHLGGAWWVNPRGYDYLERVYDTQERISLSVDHQGVRATETSRVARDDDYGNYPDAVGYWMGAHRSWNEGEEPWERARIYAPLQVAGLHRKFAALGESGSFWSFAEDYGFLGSTLARVEQTDGESWWAEEARFWVQEITTLRWLLKVWDAWRSGDEQAVLSSLVRVNDTTARVYGFGEPSPVTVETGWGRRPALDSPVYFAPGQGDESRVFRRGVRALLEGNLDRHIARTCRPVVTLQKGALLDYAPRNLLGAIYLQFLFEITGHSPESKQCAHCGTWFVPEHGRQIYCKSACNLKAYRQRVKDGKEDGNKA